MVSKEKYIVDLRRHIFKAPRVEVSLGISVAVITGLSYIACGNMVHVLLLFLFPYLMAILLDNVLIRLSSIYFPLNRIVLLNSFSFFVAFFQFLPLNYIFGFTFAFLLSFASVIIPRFMIYRTFLSERKYISYMVSVSYTLSIAVMSVLYGINIADFAGASLIYLITAMAMIHISTIPYRKEFPGDPLFFVASFVNYMARLGDEDRVKLNGYFHQIYEDREVPVSAMVFKTDEVKVKAVFLAPYIHPGPFGEVGGSDISTKIERALDMNNLMVFHTTTTHDNNIATDEDVSKLINTVREIIHGDCTSQEMSEPARFSAGERRVFAQRFGRFLFLALIPENSEFDDVELDSGLKIMNKLDDEYEGIMCIDAHNSFNKDSEPLKLSEEELDKIAEFGRMLSNKCKIKMGFATAPIQGHSIGPGGIKAAVFECEEKRYAYILIDGNNISPGLRDRIREALGALADAEVFSTDNHVVNMTMMDINPVGNGDDWNKIVDAAVKATMTAMENMENVCVFMRTKNVKLRMASSGQLAKMADVTMSSIAFAKFAIPLLSILGFATSLLLFLIIA